MSRQVLAGVVAAVAVFTLSGCGSASPGVAVHVGDQTLSTTQVDDLTVAYCEGLTPQLQSGGAVFPMSFVRGYVVRNLTVQAAAEQLAEEYSVDLPPSYEENLLSLRESLESSFREDRVEEALEVDSVGPYVAAVELAVGEILLEQEGQSGGDPEKQARGQQALEEWMSEHPADVNPRYGISITDASLDRPKFVDTSTSYPLTPNAVDAAKINSDEGPDSAHTATLPRSQRCG